MKLGRVVLLGIGVVAALLLLAIGVAFTPGFQTWAARKALADRPGLDVSVGRVSAGWKQVHLDHVRVARAGAILTLPTADFQLPVVAAIGQKKIMIRHLEARGWVLDLTRAQMPAAYVDLVAAAPTLVFAGLFNQLKLPVDLSLDGVVLAGEIVLPAVPNRPAARAAISFTGGGLAAGQPGKFDYTATIRFEGEGAVVHELKVTGTLGVVMDTPRTFSRFVVATAAEADGPKFPGGVKLAVDLTAARSAAGENYAMAILSGPKQLAAIETSYAAGDSHLRGNWRLDMHDADLAPFVLGRELPAFEAAGEGRFDLDTSFIELNASGHLNATADRLKVINSQLSGLGAVHVAAEFDFAQHGNSTRVDRLAVTIEGAKPVVTINALQPFEFNLKRGEAGIPVVTELNIADPARELVGVVLQGLPLAWLSPFLGKAGIALSGSELRGEFAASARDGGFTLRPKVPLTMGNVSLSFGEGRALLRGVDVSLSASADYTPQGWQVAIAPLSVSNGGSPAFALEARAGQLAGKDQPVKLAGDWTVYLPALLSQLSGTNTAVLTGGQAQGEFAASLGAKRELQVRMALTNLMAGPAGNLPTLSADLRADLDPDGKISFNVPVVVELAGRKSDLTLAGTLIAVKGVRTTSARLSSDLLAIDDVKAFVFPLLGLADSATPARGPSPTHPVAPFWSGFGGQWTLALKKVAYSGELQVTDFGGVLRLDPTALKLVDARAGFGPDSTVRLGGSLTFDGSSPLAYGLTADLAVDNFDVGAVFRALDPAKPPTVEGRVSLQTRLTGKAATLELLAEHTQGDLRVTGKSGIFRALSVDLSDQAQKTSRLVAIGGLLGLVTDDFVNKAKILADIAKSLSEIPYDQLSMTATRDESLNLVVKDFALISPEVRLGGSGLIRYAAGAPIVTQSMEAQLNLGARGRLGDLMKRAGLLEAQQDGLGYAAFSVPLKLGGTLAKPDTRAIRNALLTSALERSGLLDGLWGGKK